MVDYPFRNPITSEGEITDLLGSPSHRSANKALPRLDRYHLQYIARSPLLLLATSDGAGHQDVTPRGDQPGFVQPLDERTLLIPERPGNKRTDSLRNILKNPGVGLIFLIPTVAMTLRVNGIAALIRDPELLTGLEAKGKRPKLAIAVQTEEIFFHCAKAFIRSQLWDPESWQDQSDLPSLGEIYVNQLDFLCDQSAEAIDADIQDGIVHNLY